MKKILSIICTIICFAFTACYSTQSTSPEQFAAGKKYIVTGSVTPIRNNPKSEEESYKEFKELIKTQPYYDAIRNAPTKYMGKKRLKFTTIMLRFGMIGLYWKTVVRKQ